MFIMSQSLAGSKVEVFSLPRKSDFSNWDWEACEIWYLWNCNAKSPHQFQLSKYMCAKKEEKMERKQKCKNQWEEKWEKENKEQAKAILHDIPIRAFLPRSVSWLSVSFIPSLLCFPIPHMNTLIWESLEARSQGCRCWSTQLYH